MWFKHFNIHLAMVCTLLVTLIGCSTKTQETIRPSRDGHPPPHTIPKHLERIPDAVPKVEPLSRYGNRFKKNSTNVYVALKKKYSVMPTSKGYKAQGQASWYGTKFQGRKTSSGEPYDMFAMTAAHRTLPLPTYAKVTNVDTGKSIIVKVNDRGPFHNNRLIDLSYVAAHKLGIVGRGTGRVEVESIDPRDHHGRVKNVKNKNATRRHLAKNEDNFNALPLAEGQGIKEPNPKVLAANKIKGKEGKIFLQLGSFNQKGNAEELAKKVQQMSKFPSKIAENTTQIGAKYRVRIGPFKNREEAQVLSQKLAKQEFPKSIVLTE